MDKFIALVAANAKTAAYLIITLAGSTVFWWLAWLVK